MKIEKKIKNEEQQHRLDMSLPTKWKTIFNTIFSVLFLGFLLLITTFHISKKMI